MLFSDTQQPTVQYVRKGEIINVRDGDTIKVMVDQGFEEFCVQRVRVFGVNTPEIGSSRYPHETPAGEYVRRRVIRWLNFPEEKEVILHSVKYSPDQSFNRIVTMIWSQGRLLNKWLLDERLAWITNKHGTLQEDRTVESLDLPEGVKQRVRELLA